MARYFIQRGLPGILDTFSTLSEGQITPIFQNLIAPKEIQQMQAKYRGHGAEQAFAGIFTACGLSILPERKDVDPMSGYDPNVDLSTMEVVPRNAGDKNCHSFDLVVPGPGGEIRILVQSLIHSSDPGQYGVNKSEETVDIQKLVRAYEAAHPEHSVSLLGCVDGVGFSENPSGTILKMLGAFDDFFQIHTLFKIPVFLQRVGLISHVEGIALDPDYFEPRAIAHFREHYFSPAGIRDLTGRPLPPERSFPAGKGTVLLSAPPAHRRFPRVAQG